MRKSSAVLGSLIFFLAAPGTVAGFMPWLLSRWHLPEALQRLWGAQAVGAVLVAAGLVFLVDSFARFALKGLGTPAPIAPPQHLVVSGWYRHVRNPMYVALLAIILGQALLFWNVGLLAYAAIVWAAFNVFVLGYEEPTLKRMFGEEYAEFCAHVPRWIPRLRPWESSSSTA